MSRGELLFVAARLSRQESRIITRPGIKDKGVCWCHGVLTILKRRSRSIRKCFVWLTERKFIDILFPLIRNLVWWRQKDFNDFTNFSNRQNTESVPKFSADMQPSAGEFFKTNPLQARLSPWDKFHSFLYTRATELNLKVVVREHVWMAKDPNIALWKLLNYVNHVIREIPVWNFF